ncbi:MAG: hypothetical protein M0Z46_22535, partial [Actinomycetota bacterium]|nr:hypothetical protein [Actinomycetota bacterium]
EGLRTMSGRRSEVPCCADLVPMRYCACMRAQATGLPHAGAGASPPAPEWLRRAEGPKGCEAPRAAAGG